MLTRIQSGWVQNTALSELTAEKAKDTITEKMRKDLKAAFELAAQHNAVEHYEDILKNFQEELLAQEQARIDAATNATTTPKKSKKGKAKPADEDEDADVEDADTAPKSAKSKKRKAEDDISVSTAESSRELLPQRLTRGLYRPRSDPILSRSRRSSLTRPLRRRQQTALPRPSPPAALRRNPPRRNPRRPRRVPRRRLKLPRKQR